MAAPCFLQSSGELPVAVPSAISIGRLAQPATASIAVGRTALPGVATAATALSAAALIASGSRGRGGARVARGATNAGKRLAIKFDDAPAAPEKKKSTAATMRSEEELNRYQVVFSAEEDGKEWTAGKVVAVDQGDMETLITVEVEASREFIGLSRAFRSPGQRATVRFGEGSCEEVLPVASAPHSLSASRGQLWRLKGDIYAGETKKEAAPESLPVQVDVVRPVSAGEVKVGDAVEVGPFTDEGVNLRPILGRFQSPALAVFCDGSSEALCTLRGCFEAADCACELQLRDRSCVLLYCGAAPGMPRGLESWLEGVQDSFNLPIAELGRSPEGAWEESAVPAIRRLQQLGQNVGALVLGAPGFVKEMTGRLNAEGVTLIAESTDLMPLSRTVESEQI